MNSSTVGECGNVTEPSPWTSLEITLVAVPLSLIMIFIVFGNLLVAIAIMTQRNLRTPSNIYILSLAITDLCVGLFILPFNLKEMIHGWRLSEALCRIWLTADVTLCSASILHILAIAVDRFRSINEGLRYASTRSKTSSVIQCLALWFLALWIASPPALGWNDWKKWDVNADVNECALTKKLGYIVHSATGAFFIPAFVMVGLYIRIYFLLRKKFRDRATMKCIQEPQSSHDLDAGSEENSASATRGSKDTLDSVSSNNKQETHKKVSLKGLVKKGLSFSSDLDNNDSGNEGSDERDDKSSKSETLRNQVLCKQTRKHSEQISEILKKKKKYSLSKERRATFTLGILIGAFVISWTPFTLYYLSSGIIGHCSVNIVIFQIFTWLGYLNSGVNPIIYTKYNPEFSSAIKKICFFWRRNY